MLITFTVAMWTYILVPCALHILQLLLLKCIWWKGFWSQSASKGYIYLFPMEVYFCFILLYDHKFYFSKCQRPWNVFPCLFKSSFKNRQVISTITDLPTQTLFLVFFFGLCILIYIYCILLSARGIPSDVSCSLFCFLFLFFPKGIFIQSRILH